MSTSFHPQTDGAMEWANRSMIKPDQKDWVHHCPMIEFVINLSIGDATKLASFEINREYPQVSECLHRMRYKTWYWHMTH